MRPDRKESQSQPKPVEKLANPKHIDNNKRVIIIIRLIKILCLQVMVLSFMKFDFLLPGGVAAAAGYLAIYACKLIVASGNRGRVRQKYAEIAEEADYPNLPSVVDRR